MSRDSSLTFLHLHHSHHADLLEDFSRLKLPAEEIYVPPQHQPINPDDEDDIVPDQHAAFGIQRATQKVKEPAWRDLGLERLMSSAPPTSSKDATFARHITAPAVAQRNDRHDIHTDLLGVFLTSGYFTIMPCDHRDMINSAGIDTSQRPLAVISGALKEKNVRIDASDDRNNLS
ncbi:hypothetical protein Q7P37_001680 [Cladosporium fusiforme]